MNVKDTWVYQVCVLICAPQLLNEVSVQEREEGSTQRSDAPWKAAFFLALLSKIVSATRGCGVACMMCVCARATDQSWSAVPAPGEDGLLEGGSSDLGRESGPISVVQWLAQGGS